MLKKYNQAIQKFGRTLLLPIGVMAPVGMVLGITGALVQSYMIARFPFLGTPVVNTILVSIRTIASIIFDNIPLLFAMGVAYGMSKKDKGIATFASVIGYLVMLIAMNVWLKVTGNLADPGNDESGRTDSNPWNSDVKYKRAGRNRRRSDSGMGYRQVL